MKITDYIVSFLKDRGTRHVFVVTGGAIAHLVDSLGNRAREWKDINFVCVQHEQAGAMAAEAYSRLGPGIGVAVATSGPGATNLITGICGFCFDSIPGLFITGQVNTKESVESVKTEPRQVGFQETDIVNIVKPITKYAVQVRDPQSIRCELEKAYWIATTGRSGPVLIDIPVDVQIADIDPQSLEGFIDTVSRIGDSEEIVRVKVRETLTLLQQSSRPVLLLGGGIRLAHAEHLVLNLVEELNIPAIVSWSGFDLIAHNHFLFVGHLGVYGHRGSNFVVQNADMLLSIGSRLDTRQTGGDVKTFARKAKSVMVDIDSNELYKNRGFIPTIAIQSDAKLFIELLLEEAKNFQKPSTGGWLKRTKDWFIKYHPFDPTYFKQQTINAYVFVKKLSDIAKPGQIVIVDEGGNLVWTMQSWNVKKNQRIISTLGNSPMGYAFPASIGAALAKPGKDIICIDGDGGFQLNIQELQTLAHYQLPVKIFILNNRSMGIIKQFQELYFEGRKYASSPEGDYTAPDFVKVAQAYGIDAFSVDNPQDISAAIERTLSHKGPVLCNVLIDTDQRLNPKLEFGRPLEDTTPYLSDEEFASNMLIEMLPRKKETRGWEKA